MPKFNQDLPRAAASSAELTLDAVAFAHTWGRMLGGVEYNPELLATWLAIGELEPAVAYCESRKVNLAKADALFLSGAIWRAVNVIEEAGLGNPMFTASQVSM